MSRLELNMQIFDTFSDLVLLKNMQNETLKNVLNQAEKQFSY